MSSKLPSWLPIPNPIFITLILLLLQSFHSTSLPDEIFYETCSNSFNCGNITGIGYPFRGSSDPPYCGHPTFVLDCDQKTNITTLDIANTTYHVLDIYQTTQTMRIVRQDVLTDTCPQELVNTTMDDSLFDYAATCTNFTFLYGCPSMNIPGFSLLPCGYESTYESVYVVPGTLGPGACNASVVVPVHEAGNVNGLLLANNTEEFNQVLQEGFEIRWTIATQACSECTQSNGRCGFDFYSNQTTCFCPDPPYVSSTCTPVDNSASPPPETAPSTGECFGGTSCGRR